MKSKSLNTALDKIIYVLNKSNIEEIDKTELIVNIYHFLDPDKYNKNVKILKLKRD